MSTAASLSPKMQLKRSLSSAHTCQSQGGGRGHVFGSMFLVVRVWAQHDLSGEWSGFVSTGCLFISDHVAD